MQALSRATDLWPHGAQKILIKGTDCVKTLLRSPTLPPRSWFVATCVASRRPGWAKPSPRVRQRLCLLGATLTPSEGYSSGPAILAQALPGTRYCTGPTTLLPSIRVNSSKRRTENPCALQAGAQAPLVQETNTSRIQGFVAPLYKPGKNSEPLEHFYAVATL